MDLSKTQLMESVFAGGGEMAARMRALDWSTTPLGSVEQWPQALRTCLWIVLGSGYPMLVCWGSEYTILYNDAWRPVMAQKHPAGLGRSCREVFFEFWDFIGPRFEMVMTRGQDYSTLVSHEFRTPLTLMLGPLEEVLPEAVERLGPERHGQLLTVRRNALRLLKLVNTLLDFSRIEAGRVQAVYKPTDLASLTSEITSVFRSAMENAGLRFSVECQPIAEPVYVDRDLWEKVVLNLLSPKKRRRKHDQRKRRYGACRR